MVLNYKIDNLFKDLDVLDNYPASDSSDQCMDTGHTTNGSQMSVSDSDELMTRSARFSESPTPIFS